MILNPKIKFAEVDCFVGTSSLRAMTNLLRHCEPCESRGEAIHNTFCQFIFWKWYD